MLIAERILSALPSDGFIETDNAIELFDLVDADTSHSFERCHVNVVAGCDDILQDRQLNSDLEEQPTLTVIALSRMSLSVDVMISGTTCEQSPSE